MFPLYKGCVEVKPCLQSGRLNNRLMLWVYAHNIVFCLTLSARFTCLQIKQASRKCAPGQCRLIKLSVLNREQEAEQVLL